MKPFNHSKRQEYPSLGPLSLIRNYLRKQKMARRMATVAHLQEQIDRADAERSLGVAVMVGRCGLVER
jgi:hypothetical protein